MTMISESFFTNGSSFLVEMLKWFSMISMMMDIKSNIYIVLLFLLPMKVNTCGNISLLNFISTTSWASVN